MEPTCQPLVQKKKKKKKKYLVYMCTILITDKNRTIKKA